MIRQLAVLGTAAMLAATLAACDGDLRVTTANESAYSDGIVSVRSTASIYTAGSTLQLTVFNAGGSPLQLGGCIGALERFTGGRWSVVTRPGDCDAILFRIQPRGRQQIRFVLPHGLPRGRYRARFTDIRDATSGVLLPGTSQVSNEFEIR